MRQYNITEDAEQDLREIARYTLSKFGPKQLEAYRQALNSTFNAIGRNQVIQRQFSKKDQKYWSQNVNIIMFSISLRALINQLLLVLFMK
jgi:hypothetical protein